MHLKPLYIKVHIEGVLVDGGYRFQSANFFFLGVNHSQKLHSFSFTRLAKKRSDSQIRTQVKTVNHHPFRREPQDIRLNQLCWSEAYQSVGLQLPVIFYLVRNANCELQQMFPILNFFHLTPFFSGKERPKTVPSQLTIYFRFFVCKSPELLEFQAGTLRKESWKIGLRKEDEVKESRMI